MTYEGSYDGSVDVEYTPDAGWRLYNFGNPVPTYTVTGDATGAVFDLPDSHGTLTVKVLNGEYKSTSLDDPTLARVTLWENRAGLSPEAPNLPR